MTRTAQTIHTYAALLTLVNLTVYATTGAYSALHMARAGAPGVRYVAYEPVEGETARETAARLAAQLGLTLAMPIQPGVIQYTRTGGLALNFYHANGRDKVTLDYGRRQLRIETTRNSLARYLDILHMTTGVFRSGDWRMQLWAYENEFALWCFIAMLASAVWMAAARFRTLAATRLRALHAGSAAVFFPFACILGASALQMAHRTWFGPIAWAVKLHRSSGIVATAGAICIPLLAVTGLCLCYRTPGVRVMAAVLAALTIFLIVWMRW